MSPEKQRIAIAEACGWTVTGETCDTDYHSIQGYPKGQSLCGKQMELPDYLNDLNAMQSAVLTQGESFVGQFDSLLSEVAKGIGRRVVELTARDWAAVFLKLKGAI